MRLIDADDLKEKTMKWVEELKDSPDKYERIYSEDVRLFIEEHVDEQPTVEAIPVVHGEWMPVHKHMWQKDKNGEIDEWVMSYDFHNGPICEICFDTPCVHCKPDWKTTECHKESYESSECQNHVKVKTNFCSNCGAKMTK